jgi:hypothetical protein
MEWPTIAALATPGDCGEAGGIIRHLIELKRNYGFEERPNPIWSGTMMRGSRHCGAHQSALEVEAAEVHAVEEDDRPAIRGTGGWHIHIGP